MCIRDRAEGEKDLGEGRAVGDLGFGFDAVLVSVFAGAQVGEALVGEEAAAGIGADAEDFSAGAHLAVRGVVEDVGLEGAGGLKTKASGFEAAGEAGKVVDAEFDFGFDGHGQKAAFQLLALLVRQRGVPQAGCAQNQLEAGSW